MSKTAHKNKLGKGLGSLMAENAKLFNSPAAAQPETTELNPALLQPNPYQPRKVFNDAALQELADSIKEHGIIQPIVVEKKDTEYFIIAGERRTRAALLAGLDTVPVVFRNFDEHTKLEIALIENIQREDLNPIEEAKAYQEIMRLSNLNQEETAKRVGKSRSAVANALRLLQLPEEMLHAVETGSITAGHARALLSLVNPADQTVLFRRITDQSLSVREAEMQAAQLKQGIRSEKPKTAVPQPQEPLSDEALAVKDIEQQFIDALGTKVSIKGTLEKGSIEISYFSRADLDSLYETLRKN